MAKSEEFEFDNPERGLESIRRFLRGNSTGVLQYGEQVRSLAYVLDVEGEPIAPANPACLEAGDTVVHVPGEQDDALELLVTLETIDGDSAEADRWRIYHGLTDDPYFARYYIEAAKKSEYVFDGEALRERNPFASAEPAICKSINRHDPDALRAICRAQCDVDIEAPCLVGIDPYGFDVRARFGIVRVNVKERLHNIDEVKKQFDDFAHAAIERGFEWEENGT